VKRLARALIELEYQQAQAEAEAEAYEQEEKAKGKTGRRKGKLGGTDSEAAS
jgi:hypothetical protein